MNSPSPGGRHAALTPQQIAYGQEWRDLCYTLEKAQGDALCHHCHDQYQFAKTYAVFGRELDQTIEDIRQRVAQGNYSFFSQRGIPADVMTPVLAERMLSDWRHAIDAKKGHLEIVFRSKFGRTIDECLHGEMSAAPLNVAQSLEKSDAVLLLSDFVSDRSDSPDTGPLKADLEQIKLQLAYLSNAVAAIDPATIQSLPDTVRRLEADVDRISKSLPAGDT